MTTAWEDDGAAIGRTVEVSRLSHALKGRIGCILGLVEVIGQGSAGSLTDLQQQHLQRLAVVAKEAGPEVEQLIALALYDPGGLTAGAKRL